MLHIRAAGRRPVARTRDAKDGVHVRAVHVDLAAIVVDQLADARDPRFEDAVRRRVGDHESGQVRRQKAVIEQQTNPDTAIGCQQQAFKKQ